MKRLKEDEIHAIMQDIRNGMENWEIMKKHGVCFETIKRISRAIEAIDKQNYSYLDELYYNKKVITSTIYYFAANEIDKALYAEHEKQPLENIHQQDTKPLDELRAPKPGEILYTLMQIESIIHELLEKTKEQV